MTGFSSFDAVALLASAILRRRIAEADAERLERERIDAMRETCDVWREYWTMYFANHRHHPNAACGAACDGVRL